MGHLVNPISLRLGRTQHWRSQWYKATNSDYLATLKEDFILYKYIESYFKYSHLIKKRIYTIAFNKFKNKNIKKNKNYNLHLRPSKRKKIRIKRYVQSKMINKLSLIFSHANVIRFAKHLIINMYIYDGALETFIEKQPINTAFHLNYNKKFKKNIRNSFDSRRKVNFNNSKIKRTINNKFKKTNAFSKMKSGINRFFYELYMQNLKKSKNFRRKIHYRRRRNFRRKKIRNNYLEKFLEKKKSKNSKEWVYQIRRRIRNRLLLRMQAIANSNKKCLSLKVANLLSPARKKYNVNLKHAYVYRSLKNLALIKNLTFELRFINSKLYYFCNSINTAFNLPTKKYSVNKPRYAKNTKYFFKIVKLLSMFHFFLKKTYKNRLQNIFILRLLAYSLARLRTLINKRLNKTVEKKIKIFHIGMRNLMRRKKYKNLMDNKYKLTKIIRKRDSKLVFCLSKKKEKLKLNRRKKLIVKTKFTVFRRNYLRLSKFLLYVYCLAAEYDMVSNSASLDLYKARFKIWFYVSRVLFENIKTLLNSKYKYYDIKFNYFGLTNTTPTAAMIVNYITTKLYQKYTLFEVLKPIAKDLARNFTIDGFKISCAGRLTKKERASVFVQKDKKVPANTIDSFIDYATSTARLRHGVCGLKIWITRKRTYKAFAYNFSYTYKL